MTSLQNQDYRMLAIVSLLSANEDRPFSISELSELLGVDLPTIRSDIASLYNKDIDALSILTDDEDLDDALFESEPVTVQNEIKKGKYDDAPLMIEKNYEKKDRQVDLVLNQSEFEALKPFLSEFLADADIEIGRDNGISVKNMDYDVLNNDFWASEMSVYQKIDRIRSAIAEKKPLLMSYKRGAAKKIEFNKPVFPVSIIFEKSNRQFYLEAVNLNLINGRYVPWKDRETNDIVHTEYRLDRILSLELEQNPAMDPINVSPYDWSRVWGLETGRSPVHVKIKIYDEAGVPERIRRDLGGRSKETLKKYDGYYIYEDDIVGVNKFRSWIRSYGSSVVVLEPQEIRDKVLESVKEQLKMYAENTSV